MLDKQTVEKNGRETYLPPLSLSPYVCMVYPIFLLSVFSKKALSKSFYVHTYIIYIIGGMAWSSCHTLNTVISFADLRERTAQ